MIIIIMNIIFKGEREGRILKAELKHIDRMATIP